MNLWRPFIPAKRRAFDPTGYTLTPIRNASQPEEPPEYELIGIASDTSGKEMLYVIQHRDGSKFTATPKESNS